MTRPSPFRKDNYSAIETFDNLIRYKHEEVGKSPDRPYCTHPDNITLQALVCCGDTLYIPRGFVHEGVASKDASMHITVALQTSDWDYVHLISRAVERCLQEHFPARACPYFGGGDATGDALDAPLHEETEGKFRSFCQEALGRLSLGHAASCFKERIQALREERDKEAMDNMPLDCPAPLYLHSRIVWNCDVLMEWQMQQESTVSGSEVAVPDEDDERMIICKFTRHSTGQVALLSASPQLVSVLTHASSLRQPFTISSIEASSDMFRICVAKLMIRNGYCLLVENSSS